MADQLAERPGGAPDREELALDAMDLLERRLGRAFEDFVLELAEPLGIPLQPREVAIDEAVEQDVEQEAGIVLPEAGSGHRDPLPDRREILSVGALERQERRPAEEHAELVAVEPAFAPIDRSSNDEEPAGLVLV